VVGSANLDIVVRVTRFPSPGETLLGAGLEEVPGGKGLNQALAAARSVSCALIGRVGDDPEGHSLREVLQAGGVEVAHVRRSTLPTGRAFIQVTADGENSIVVLALANGDLQVTDVVQALESSRPAVVSSQLEVPLDCVLAAAHWAGDHGARFVLNASPMRGLPVELLAACDPLVVNRREAAELLAGADGVADADALPTRTMAERLAAQVRSVVVTEGARGVHVGSATDTIRHIEAVTDIRAVDTTGAGDEFAGALAAALSVGASLREAAALANAAAGHIVTVPRGRR
jgi:ribokinase